MNGLHRSLRRVRRVLLLRRRPLAAALAGLAVFLGLQAVGPPAPRTSPMVVAAHDLRGGAVLSGDDLTTVEVDPATVPAGAVDLPGAVGRTTATPVRAGEPLTDVRLVGGGLLTGYPGRVAAPVRIADAGAVSLLRVGDLVDVLAADPQGAAAQVVAARVPVVALPRAPQSTMASGGLVVLAVDEGTARDLASASVGHYLSLAITH